MKPIRLNQLVPLTVLALGLAAATYLVTRPGGYFETRRSAKAPVATSTPVRSTGNADQDLKAIDQEMESVSSDTDLPVLKDSDLGL